MSHFEPLDKFEKRQPIPVDYTRVTEPLYSPIIVTGCARSGTSLVAGVLHICGAWIGDCTGPTRWNKKGQFENEFIRDELTKPFLKSIGADPMGQDPLPPLGWQSAHFAQGISWREKVVEAVKAQGYTGDRPWMFKGAKACLIWPIWKEAFPRAKWVVVRRPDEKIIDSCMRTSFMRKRNTRESWKEWVEYHKEKFLQMEEAGLNMRDIWPFQNGEANMGFFEVLVYSLGLTWDAQKVDAFIDPDLLHI